MFKIEKWRDEQGATAVEYGLLVGLIAVFLISAMTTLGDKVSDTFKEAACKVSGGTWTADALSGGTVIPGSCNKP